MTPRAGARRWTWVLAAVGIAGAVAGLLWIGGRPGGPAAGEIEIAPRDDAGPLAPAEAPRMAPAPGGRERRPNAPGEGDAAPPPDDAPAIEGVVVDAETDQPLAGATVVAMPSDDGRPCPYLPPAPNLFAKEAPTAPGVWLERSGTQILGHWLDATTTDGEGRFRVERATGPLDLTARLAGFVTGQTCRATPGGTVRLRLARGLSVEGVTVRPDGKPVAGATVWAKPAAGLPEVPGRVETATSDEQGRFALTGLVAGRVALSAKARGHMEVGHPFFPFGTSPPSEGAPGPVVDAGAKGVRIVLTPAFEVLFEITTSDGQVPSAPTAAWKTDGRPAREGLLLLPAADFEALQDVPMEDWPVVAWGPARLPCDRAAVTFTVKAVGYEAWTSDPLAIPSEGGSLTLPVPLRRDPALGSLKVLVEDPTGRPLSWVAEACEVGIGRRDGRPVEAGVVMQPGEALTFPALPEGPYRLSVSSPRHAPAVLEVDIAPGLPHERRLALGAPARLRVRFTAAESGVVRFRVLRDRFPAALYLEGAVGYILGHGDGRPSGPPEERELATGGEAVTLTGLGAGRHEIQVVSAEFEAPPTVVDLAEGDLTEVEVALRRR